MKKLHLGNGTIYLKGYKNIDAKHKDSILFKEVKKELANEETMLKKLITGNVK